MGNLHFMLFFTALLLSVGVIHGYETLHSAATTIDHASMAADDLQNKTPDELDLDWNLERYLGSIFVINLPAAKDRLEKITYALNEIGVREFEVMEGVDGRNEVDSSLWDKMNWNWAKVDLTTLKGQHYFNRQRQGETGCYLSHLKVIRAAKERFETALELADWAQENNDGTLLAESLKQARKYSRILILEDDNGFGIVSEDKSSYSLTGMGLLFRLAMQSLPAEWDLLNLMPCSRQAPLPHSEHLVLLTDYVKLNAYAINHTLYDPIIERLERIFDPLITQVKPVDDEIATFTKTHRCFAITPSIAFQGEGKSFITSHERTLFLQTQATYTPSKPSQPTPP